MHSERRDPTDSNLPSEFEILAAIGNVDEGQEAVDETYVAGTGSSDSEGESDIVRPRKRTCVLLDDDDEYCKGIGENRSESVVMEVDESFV